MNSKQYGAKPTAEHIRRYEASPNWTDGKFHNLEETLMSLSPLKIPEVIYKQIKARTKSTPDRPIDIVSLDLESFTKPSDLVKFVWYGHSALLMRLDNKTIFLDPMMGPDASPIGPIRTKRFSNNTLDILDDLPDIDLVLLTHDHYDHLDLASIDKLKKKTNQYFVALGVKRHLVKWGVDPGLIIEFDWWDQRVYEHTSITFTPTRHFSGRGLKDRAKSLWGGWAFRTQTENIWFSGDSGYGTHFQEIGTRLGPFDIAFMECGQYNENWAQIHMFPEEGVKAALEAGVAMAVPVHWGGFTLAPHHWTDPATRFRQAAVERDLPLGLPRIGEVFSRSEVSTAPWWENF